MKKFVKLVGVLGLAAGAAAVTTFVLNDAQTRQKVSQAAQKAKKAAREFADGFSEGIRHSGMTQTEKNQAWVDEQWEALGI